MVLAGHSMGGMTIMEYAHRHPEEFAARVAGLVFVSTTAEGTTHTRYGLPPAARPADARWPRRSAPACWPAAAPWRPHRAVLPALRPALRWLLFGDELRRRADMRLTMSAVGRASLRSIGGFRASIGAQHRLDTLAALGDVPAAVLVGDRDRLTPPPCAESIAEALPGTELTVCPGAGHMLMLERPDEVTAALAVVGGRTSGRPPAAPARTERAATTRPPDRPCDGAVSPSRERCQGAPAMHGRERRRPARPVGRAAVDGGPATGVGSIAPWRRRPRSVARETSGKHRLERRHRPAAGDRGRAAARRPGVRPARRAAPGRRPGPRRRATSSPASAHFGALVERDAMVFHAARRRHALDTEHEGLVFGRLDLRTGAVHYVGRLGIRDENAAAAGRRLAGAGRRRVLPGHRRPSRWAWSAAG